MKAKKKYPVEHLRPIEAEVIEPMVQAPMFFMQGPDGNYYAVPAPAMPPTLPPTYPPVCTAGFPAPYGPHGRGRKKKKRRPNPKPKDGWGSLTANEKAWSIIAILLMLFAFVPMLRGDVCTMFFFFGIGWFVGGVVGMSYKARKARESLSPDQKSRIKDAAVNAGIAIGAEVLKRTIFRR